MSTPVLAIAIPLALILGAAIAATLLITIGRESNERPGYLNLTPTTRRRGWSWSSRVRAEGKARPGRPCTLVGVSQRQMDELKRSQQLKRSQLAAITSVALDTAVVMAGLDPESEQVLARRRAQQPGGEAA